MTESDARKKAEEIVFVYYVLGDIIDGCKRRNIPTTKKNGKPRSRSDMEEDLINAMTKEMTTE